VVEVPLENGISARIDCNEMRSDAVFTQVVVTS